MDSQIRLSSDKENVHPMNHAFPKQQVSGTPSSSLNLAPKLRESSYSRSRFETHTVLKKG